VRLAHPLILAAGMVKGDGFANEPAALAAVDQRRNIVPGWRSMPALVGAVEFGSFTRHPRLGNAGRTMWRSDATRSMQNRVGLRNPGARAAAAHLRAHADALPQTWGINLATSPGLTDVEHSRTEIVEAAGFFNEALGGTARGPSWLTLNLSCPNTEDDSQGNQSAELARELCEALAAASAIPVWVKVGPDLSDAQLQGLVGAFVETGVAAVVATNTWAQPVPGAAVSAGSSGAGLRPRALDTVARLSAAIADANSDLDIVASGGVLDGDDLLAFEAAGARAAMVYSALVFRGPLAAALILREAAQGGSHA
jgi:dihydroorotate dehydrogenase